jgi:hypothetical protein
MSTDRVFDLSFSNDGLLPERCSAAVLLSPEGVVQVALMEIAENHGRSVTNSWPGIARHFMATHLPTLPIEATRWFEVYPYRIDGCVSRVLITADGHRFEYEQDPAVRKTNLASVETASKRAVEVPVRLLKTPGDDPAARFDAVSMPFRGLISVSEQMGSFFTLTSLSTIPDIARDAIVAHGWMVRRLWAARPISPHLIAIGCTRSMHACRPVRSLICSTIRQS